MAYGLKYTCDFSNKVTSYTLEIYQKDFVGYETEITGGASAVIHSYETDEPKPPIKGSSITANLINESNNISLADLYSTDDEEFKMILVWHASLTDINLFEGFIVQDDSSELMVDYNHEISISANDNLGLLKDIPFNEARFQPLTLEDTFTTEFAGGTPPHIISVNPNVGETLQVNDTIVITLSNVDGTYNIIAITPGILVYDLTVREVVPTGADVSVATIEVYTPDYYTLRSLNSFIKSCLLSTGLELEVYEFTNLNEITQDDDDCFLDQTFIDPQIFYNGSQWDDCYTVLEKILGRFNCTLFQAKGRWQIIRWPELRDFDYSIPGFAYDEDFVFQGTIEFNEATGGFAGWPKWEIGIGELTQAELGLRRGIKGAYKFTKETFNYRQPVKLLRNYDLQELGTLINTYTTGSGVTLQTINEYEAPGWFDSTLSGNTAIYFIRVTTDYIGNEIERIMVVSGDDIKSTKVEVQQGDIFKFFFSWRTNDSIPISSGSATVIFIIELKDGTSTKYLHEPTDATPGWQNGIGYQYTMNSPDNFNEWHSVEIECPPLYAIPFDGNLYFYLETLDPNNPATQPTWYKDIRLEYTPLIAGSAKVIGHTHTSDQRNLIKNLDEKQLSIDVSPRNAIAGTLFLPTVTGVLQDRCTQWIRKPRTESKNLGDITTSENLFLRRISRTLLEGTFYGLISPPQPTAGSDIVDHITILTVIRYTFFPDHNFIFGRLEIDYSNNNASGTLYEMYKDTEVDGDLTYYYTFQFLYDSR